MIFTIIIYFLIPLLFLGLLPLILTKGFDCGWDSGMKKYNEELKREQIEFRNELLKKDKSHWLFYSYAYECSQIVNQKKE